MPLTAGRFQVVIDPKKLAKAASGPNGGYVRYGMQQAQKVKVEAQRLVGVGKIPPAGPRPTRRPGTLRDSIVVRLVASGEDGFRITVGSEDPIALWHHEGTQPHTIVPRRAPRLVFWSAKAGRVVVAKKVNHPGTKPNRFLTQAAANVLR